MRLVRKLDALELSHGRRDQASPDGGGCDNLQDPPPAGGDHLGSRCEFREGHQQAPRFLFEGDTLFGQLHPSTDPVQQFEAKLGLEILNGACHRWLGTPEHISRLGNAAAGSNRKEGLKVPGFHLRLHAYFVSLASSHPLLACVKPKQLFKGHVF
ncbi:hypothetical protein MESS4_830192 [Mesorhizobium sp. STM 4661]|nr:hypothetical protein MESS4_830192 [Mesorhizobium sp. STM 4661]